MLNGLILGCVSLILSFFVSVSYLSVAPGIMALDVGELCGVLKRRNIPIQLSEPLVDIWVARADISDIRLEMLDIHSIEANDGGEESDIGFCDVLAEIERPFGFREVLFYFVETAEESCDGFLVGFLCGCEPGLVHTIVDIIIRPIVGRFDFLLQRGWEELDVAVFLSDDVVKLGELSFRYTSAAISYRS